MSSFGDNCDADLDFPELPPSDQSTIDPHDTLKKPETDGVCDKCGSTEFKRRPDDNAEAMRTRLQVYYKDTSPLIGYYYAKRKLKVVDGMASIEGVSEEIEEVLGNL